ncbi:MAG TPA: YciI family protein [Burkholderiaceae bacterium]|nr:YciI family protein [Burkholderiaceae bacterium]
MKYLCLCYYDTDAFANLSAEDAAAIGPACRPHDQALRATGKVVLQGSLCLPQDWVHFHPHNGQPVRAEGPLLPGPRQAGAFFVVEAGSKEEAETVACLHAAARFGEHLGFAVEVRACETFEASGFPAGGR